jgi:DNA-binding PadR family transcriptional regulator
MMILGLVRWMQPVHGYDVRRELLSWGADKWAHVAPGSIYHALRKLTGEGMLREVATEQVGSRPARTTYEITARGEDEFGTLLRARWWGVEPPADPFLAAFSLLPAMPRTEASAALRNRAQQLRVDNDRLRAGLDAMWMNRKPAHVGWMFELGIARGEAEIAWCERVAGLIDSGVSYLPASVLGDEDRERWRESALEQ